MATLTAFSDTSDGYIRSSSTTYSTAQGGANFATNTVAASTAIASQQFNTGNSTYFLFESAYRFDTSSLGSVSISSTVFSLYGTADNSTQDYTIVVKPYDWGTTLATGDWRTPSQLSSLTTLASFATSGGWSTTGYNDFSESGSALSDAVDTSGTTHLLLASDRMISGDAPATDGTREDVSASYADETGTTQDPKLVVTYTSIEITSVTPSEFADGDTGITIAGSGFEASQGTGKVELGDSSDYATATLVAQTVTSWSDTSIDFTVDQGALGYGSVWVFVTSDAGNTTDGFECTIPVEGQGDLTIPMLGLSAAGVQTFEGTSELIAPFLNMAAQGQASEPIGTGLLTISMLQLASQGEAPPISGAADLVVPMIALESTGIEVYPGVSNLILFPLNLEAKGEWYIPGSGQILVPAVEFQGSGQQVFSGTSVLTLPLITLISFAGTRDQTFVIEGALRYPIYRGSLIVPRYLSTIPYSRISTVREL